MKKTYIAPTIELIEYEVEDVLLASGMLGLLSEKAEATYSVSKDSNPIWFN